MKKIKLDSNLESFTQEMAMEIEEKSTILYHGNCIDGWFSAYIAQSALGPKGPVQMFAISPNQPATWPTSQELSGTHIYLVDISVPSEYRDKWLNAGALSIECIDHHATSIEHWPADANPIDVTMCAALQVWHFFYPGTLVPGWLLAVDRIDRWTDVTDQDRCLREIMSIIAHKPLKGKLEEALADTLKFIEDMNDMNMTMMYLQQGYMILAQKDAALLQILGTGHMVDITSDVQLGWNLPATWIGRKLFTLDNSRTSIDTTEAAHLVFMHHPEISIFVNYRKQPARGKGKPRVIYSARARELDITAGTFLRGHPSAAGACIEVDAGIILPFVL